MAKPKIFEVLLSVLAAFAGVQTDQNRRRDFSQGSLGVYVAVGLAVTVLFVGVVIGVVSLVLG